MKFGGTPRDFIALRQWLRGLDGTAVLDHLGGINPTDGCALAILDLAGELLSRGNWWISLAGNARPALAGRAGMGGHARRRARLCGDGAGSRRLGSDWPHVLYGPRPLPAYESLLAFLRRAVPDAATLETILVRNPARLYGFAEAG